MIYYLTVHWKSDDWIDIQLEMIRRYTSVEYRVYAYLTGIDKSHYAKFDFIIDDKDLKHEQKLNILADQVITKAHPDDWIVFLDGDAFPITEITVLSENLHRHQLVAVQRLENLGEKQPHPCFCLTTIALWKQIQGTWTKGYKWINAMGNPETDVGGELLGRLEKWQIPWLPLHRTNVVNLNPVFFGIYGDIVYHHGAGFRGGGCRIIWYEEGLYEVYKRPDARILNNIVPLKWQQRVRNSLIHPEGRMKQRIARSLKSIQERVFSSIKRDPEYVQTFIQSVNAE